VFVELVGLRGWPDHPCGSCIGGMDGSIVLPCHRRKRTCTYVTMSKQFRVMAYSLFFEVQIGDHDPWIEDPNNVITAMDTVPIL
jgi:hypothetical protein